MCSLCSVLLTGPSARGATEKLESTLYKQEEMLLDGVMCSNIHLCCTLLMAGFYSYSGASLVQLPPTHRDVQVNMSHFIVKIQYNRASQNNISLGAETVWCPNDLV